MFFGQFHHRLNTKNQVTIPARLRDVVPEDERNKGFYLVRSNPECLYLYTHTEIQKTVDRLRSSSSAVDPEFRRMLTSRITPVDMDAQGRIVIPAELKKAAGIDADVVFLGNAERMELWALDRWTAFESGHEPGYERKLGEMMDDLFER